MQPMPEPQPVQVGPTLAEWNERFTANLEHPPPGMVPAEQADWARRATTEQLGERPPAHVKPAERVPDGDDPRVPYQFEGLLSEGD